MKVKCEKCNIYSEIANDTINENQKTNCPNCSNEYNFEESRKILKNSGLNVLKNNNIEENGNELIIKRKEVDSKQIFAHLLILVFFGLFLGIFINSEIQTNLLVANASPNSILRYGHSPTIIKLYMLPIFAGILFYLYLLTAELTNKKTIKKEHNTVSLKYGPLPYKLKAKKINIEDIKNIEIIHPDENIKKEKKFNISLTLKNQEKVNIFECCSDIYEAISLENKIKEHLNIDDNRKNDAPWNICTKQSNGSLQIETEKRPFFKTYSKNITTISMYILCSTPLAVSLIESSLNAYLRAGFYLILAFAVFISMAVIFILASLSITEIWYLSLIAEIDENSLSLKYSPLAAVWKKKININDIKNIFIRQEKRFPVKKETDKNISIINYNPLNPFNKIEDLDTFFIIELKDGKTLKIYTPIKDSSLLVYISNSIKKFIGIPAAAAENT